MAKAIQLLVVDRDASSRSLLRRALDDSGIAATIDVADDPAVAFARTQQATYDCILVDQDVPGIDFVERLRAVGSLTPIVFIVGQRDEDTLQAAVEAGITDFVLKQDISPRRLRLRIGFAIRTGFAEAESSRSLAAANVASRARDEVLAIVSHDLRGPLHAIGLAVEALRDEVTPAGIRLLGAIERSADRAERLIADLLEASAIENGALTLTRSSVDARSIVRQAAADHELLVKEGGGRILAHVPDEPILVAADRDRVLQVLGNLIGNALTHARGTPIDLSLASDRGEARISVRDGGPGIGEQELPFVFDRYWHGRTQKHGAGLGLAIAKGIVDAHGGRLSVASRAGEGTEFTFTLPVSGTDRASP